MDTTDKVDCAGWLWRKADPDVAVKELIGAIGSNAAELIIRDRIQGVNNSRFADKLVGAIGTHGAETIVREKTDHALLIEKLLKKNPGAEQKIIGILTDPNNTGLIIKAFAEKYPEKDLMYKKP